MSLLKNLAAISRQSTDNSVNLPAYGITHAARGNRPCVQKLSYISATCRWISRVTDHLYKIAINSKSHCAYLR